RKAVAAGRTGPPAHQSVSVYDPSPVVQPDAEAAAPVAKAPVPKPLLNAETFLNPPKYYRPWTVWWWFGNASNERDLVRELAEMDSHGIGVVEINSVYPLDLPPPQKPDTVAM